MNRRCPFALLLAFVFAGSLPAADNPVQIRILSDAPDALVHVTYNGSMTIRAKPVLILDTWGDLGKLRVPMRMNDKGTYEAVTFVNRIGTYGLSFEGEDLKAGGKITDDNSGKLYNFEVTTPAERLRRENELRYSAEKSIRKELPQFRDATVFFNNRQAADSRTAIVRDADGKSVYRVRVNTGGRRNVTILEKVK